MPCLKSTGFPTKKRIFDSRLGPAIDHLRQFPGSCSCYRKQSIPPASRSQLEMEEPFGSMGDFVDVGKTAKQKQWKTSKSVK